MIRSLSRLGDLAAAFALALSLGTALLLVSGCEGDRKPIPVIHVTVLREPGTYLLENERLYLTELKSELQRVADKYRRETTHTARAKLIVAYDPAVPYHRVEEALGMCAEVGLDKIETQVRQETALTR